MTGQSKIYKLENSWRYGEAGYKITGKVWKYPTKYNFKVVDINDAWTVMNYFLQNMQTQHFIAKMVKQEGDERNATLYPLEEYLRRNFMIMEGTRIKVMFTTQTEEEFKLIMQNVLMSIMGYCVSCHELYDSIYTIEFGKIGDNYYNHQPYYEIRFWLKLGTDVNLVDKTMQTILNCDTHSPLYVENKHYTTTVRIWPTGHQRIKLGLDKPKSDKFPRNYDSKNLNKSKNFRKFKLGNNPG